jgi:putative hydrolase of the HAD superfamily
MPSGPPTHPIQAVIFDFGNVLCAFDNGRIAAALAPVCGRTPQELAGLIAGSDLPRAYEAGAIGSAAFLAGLSELCGCAFEEGFFLRAFTDIFTPIPGTWQLVRELKGRLRLGLLSNTNPWHFEHGIRTTAIFPLFETVTLSFEVGALKPDRRIFEDALAKLALPPEACVFVDDIPGFVEGARRLGLHGIPFTGPVALRAALRALGVEA